jgi:hypothetical protein
MTSLVVSLIATIGCLGAAIWAGVARRRRLHYALVAGTLALLGVAIWRAELYGSTLVFEGSAQTVHRVHMVFVTLTFLALPGVGWTGFRLARAHAAQAPGARVGHRKLAVVFVVLVLITAALGTAMTVLAQPDPRDGSARSLGGGGGGALLSQRS